MQSMSWRKMLKIVRMIEPTANNNKSLKNKDIYIYIYIFFSYFFIHFSNKCLLEIYVIIH